MLNQFKKAVTLAKKTGDKLIVFNTANSDLAYVVMSLDEYEKIALGRNEVKNLTEEELLDRINRDIAIWKSEQITHEGNFPKNPNFYSNLPTDDDFSFSEDSDSEDFPAEEPVQTDNFFVHDELVDQQGEMKKTKKNWTIPAERKEGAEEIIEEDRQYLEELTF